MIVIVVIIIFLFAWGLVFRMPGRQRIDEEKSYDKNGDIFS